MRSHHQLAELAKRQYGVVAYRQLRDLRFSKGHISRAQQAGRLRRIHQGVYAIGHAGLSPHARCMAAILVFPEGAVLSHWSAAWLWGLATTAPREVEVTVAARGNRRAGLRVHRVWSLHDQERTAYEGLPVTTPARTLIDIASNSSPKQLARVVDRARRRGKLDLDATDSALSRCKSRHMAQRLEEALRIYREPVSDRARSELLLLDAIKVEGVLIPDINTFVAGYEVDVYWERERFAVEVDGWETHGNRRAFEDDRLRQEELKLAGIDSIRISARRIEREPAAVARRLRLLLERRRTELDL